MLFHSYTTMRDWARRVDPEDLPARAAGVSEATVNRALAIEHELQELRRKAP
jgi:hypothetical protein